MTEPSTWSWLLIGVRDGRGRAEYGHHRYRTENSVYEPRRLYPYLLASACVALVLSNVLAGKLVSLFGLTVNGATLIYPLTFLLADVITEVYGYAAARRVIWASFALQVAAVGAIEITLHAPAAIPPQAVPFERALDLSLWIVVGSLAGFWCGDFLNSFVISRLKLLTRGRWLWTRTIASTVAGQAVDTSLFVLIAFGFGNWVQGHPLPAHVLWSLVWGVYVLKVVVETVLTPLVYLVVNRLKRAEQLDTFDQGADYNPFTVAA